MLALRQAQGERMSAESCDRSFDRLPPEADRPGWADGHRLVADGAHGTSGLRLAVRGERYKGEEAGGGKRWFSKPQLESWGMWA